MESADDVLDRPGAGSEDVLQSVVGATCEKDAARIKGDLVPEGIRPEFTAALDDQKVPVSLRYWVDMGYIGKDADSATELRLSERTVSLGSALMAVVMAAAAVVVAAAVAVNDLSAEILLEQSINRKLGSTGMDLDAHLVEHVHGSGAKTSADDVRAALGGDETRHRAVLVLRCFQSL